VTTESKFIIDSLGPFDLDRQIVTLVPNFKDIHNYPQFWDLANEKPFWQIFKDIANGVFIVPREVGYEDVVLPAFIGDFPPYWNGPFYDVPSYRRYRGISDFQNRTRSVSLKYLGAGIEDRIWIGNQFFSIDKEYNATQNRFFNFITMQSWDNIEQWSPHISSIMWDNSIGYLSRVQGSDGVSFSSLLLEGSQGVSFWSDIGDGGNGISFRSDVTNGGSSALSCYFLGNNLELSVLPNQFWSIVGQGKSGGTNSWVFQGLFGSITFYSPGIRMSNPDVFGDGILMLVDKPWSGSPVKSWHIGGFATSSLLTHHLYSGGTIYGFAMSGMSADLRGVFRGEQMALGNQRGIHRYLSAFFYDGFRINGRMDTTMDFFGNFLSSDNKVRADIMMAHGSVFFNWEHFRYDTCITMRINELGFGMFRGLACIVGGVESYAENFSEYVPFLDTQPSLGKFYGVPCTHDAFDIYARGIVLIPDGYREVAVDMDTNQYQWIRWDPSPLNSDTSKNTMVFVTPLNNAVRLTVDISNTPGRFTIKRHPDDLAGDVYVQWIVIGERKDTKALRSIDDQPTNNWDTPSTKPYIAYDDSP
jgi:hypothetical protein